MNFYTSSILALILFYILLVIVMFFFQRSLLYHPSVDNYLKDQTEIEPTEIKKVKISEISKTKFRVYLGPFKNLETLKKNFNDISKLKFENIEIVKL